MPKKECDFIPRILSPEPKNLSSIPHFFAYHLCMFSLHPLSCRYKDWENWLCSDMIQSSQLLSHDSKFYSRFCFLYLSAHFCIASRNLPSQKDTYFDQIFSQGPIDTFYITFQLLKWPYWCACCFDCESGGLWQSEYIFQTDLQHPKIFIRKDHRIGQGSGAC